MSPIAALKRERLVAPRITSAAARERLRAQMARLTDPSARAVSERKRRKGRSAVTAGK